MRSRLPACRTAPPAFSPPPRAPACPRPCTSPSAPTSSTCIPTPTAPPSAAAAGGAGGLSSCRLPAGVVGALGAGVSLTLGPAVAPPGVLGKALPPARNVGRGGRRIPPTDMAFARHYRPAVNVVGRPTATGG